MPTLKTSAADKWYSLCVMRNLAVSYYILQILIEDVRMLGSFKNKTLSWWTVNFLFTRKHDMARKHSTDKRMRETAKRISCGKGTAVIDNPTKLTAGNSHIHSH